MAGTGGVLDHLTARIGKDEIQRFERFDEGLRFGEIRGRDVHEDGVASEARYLERMFDLCQLGIEQVLKRVVGVVDLGFCQEFGVALDVGKDEIAFVCHACSKQW